MVGMEARGAEGVPELAHHLELPTLCMAAMEARGAEGALGDSPQTVITYLVHGWNGSKGCEGVSRVARHL